MSVTSLRGFEKMGFSLATTNGAYVHLPEWVVSQSSQCADACHCCASSMPEFNAWVRRADARDKPCCVHPCQPGVHLALMRGRLCQPKRLKQTGFPLLTKKVGYVHLPQMGGYPTFTVR